jgi:hypothetical protein
MINTKNKPKKNKRRCNYEKTTHTLDVCHEKQLDQFSKEYNNLNKLERELKIIEKKIKKINNSKNNTNQNNKDSNIINSNTSDSNISDSNNILDKSDKLNTIYELNSKKKHIINTINSINSKKKEIEYLTNTSDILFNYYDSIENTTDNSNNPNVKK